MFIIRIATKANATARLGGPQGLNSCAIPERSGAIIRPTDVTDCPTPRSVPLASFPPMVSSRSMMQVRPIVVEKAKKVEDKMTIHMLSADAYRRINVQVKVLECNRSL